MFTANLFTGSLKFTKIIKRFFHIKEIFYEKNKKNRDLIQFCRNSNIKIRKVKNFSEIKKKIFNGSDLGIIYGFGIIFTKNYIQNYRYGVWNCHPGELPKYRGRHPISWAFLNNEKKIGITIHKIDERIDRGRFLTKAFVKRNMDDDINDIEKKILIKLPKLIIDALKKIKSKRLLKIGKGTYRQSLYNGVKIKNPINYDYMYIYNAVKAQSTFGGIRIGKLNFKNVFFYNKKKLKVLKKFIIVTCKDNKKLILVK